MASSRSRGPRPRKSLGQHFLRDSGILADIAAAVRVPEGGVVLEIGAGTGQLTEALLDAGMDVVALEVEDRLIPHLRKRFRGRDRLRIVQGDAREVDIAKLLPENPPFAVVGNLPYFAANPIIRHFLEGTPKPTEMVVMVQREVARELAAKPGQASLLAISVQVYAEGELLFDVPPEAFDPPPNVWSSVVRLTLRPQPLVPPERLEAFFELVSKTFRNPRKQIHNALGRGVWLPPDGAGEALAEAEIDPMRRPETLSVADWLRLLDACEAVCARA
ncbi:MAG: 16S rRNA (adenine(1518)-N(6)/adenine(1519)-N(6))-dimethyltransferase RsmA [Dehalococcoidia bacterium]|nr:16S rRNA (adenine(1518)-N(6)/adenine(1519)-N(6))-dimethyltransferase RsmA [Dehalococcoidia bacterium]